MEGSVYKDSPHTLLGLKEAIANIIRTSFQLNCFAPLERR
jgi:hypothetical protein